MRRSVPIPRWPRFEPGYALDHTGEEGERQIGNFPKSRRTARPVLTVGRPRRSSPVARASPNSTSRTAQRLRAARVAIKRFQGVRRVSEEPGRPAGGRFEFLPTAGCTVRPRPRHKAARAALATPGRLYSSGARPTETALTDRTAPGRTSTLSKYDRPRPSSTTGLLLGTLAAALRQRQRARIVGPRGRTAAVWSPTRPERWAAGWPCLDRRRELDVPNRPTESAFAVRAATCKHQPVRTASLTGNRRVRRTRAGTSYVRLRVLPASRKPRVTAVRRKPDSGRPATSSRADYQRSCASPPPGRVLGWSTLRRHLVNIASPTVGRLGRTAAHWTLAPFRAESAVPPRRAFSRIRQRKDGLVRSCRRACHPACPCQAPRKTRNIANDIAGRFRRTRSTLIAPNRVA